MRILGIDFGLKRVGLALCDPSGIVVTPWRTIERTTRDVLFGELTKAVEDEGVEAVVVGLPLTLDGEDSLITRQARNFAESLGRRVAVPVHLMDERLSSAEADHHLDDAQVFGKKRKMARDAQAAALILEAWLACERR